MKQVGKALLFLAALIVGTTLLLLALIFVVDALNIVGDEVISAVTGVFTTGWLALMLWLFYGRGVWRRHRARRAGEREEQRRYPAHAAEADLAEEPLALAVSTTYTEETLRETFRFLRTGQRGRSFHLYLGALFLMVAAAAVWMRSWIYLLCIGAFALGLFLVPRQDRKASRNPRNQGVVEYLFYDTYFTTHFHNRVHSGKDVVSYGEVKRVCDTPGAVYIQTKTHGTYRITKSDLSPVEGEELPQLLRDRFPGSFQTL